MTFEEVQARIERSIEAQSIPAEVAEDVQWMLSKLAAFKTAANGVFARRAIAKKNTKPNEGKAFIDAFHQLYVEHTGQKPTWGQKENGVARALVKQHGIETCLARARFMFDGKGPAYLKTRDITTLRMHFDKFLPVNENSLPGFDDLFAEEGA